MPSPPIAIDLPDHLCCWLVCAQTLASLVALAALFAAYAIVDRVCPRQEGPGR
jgi:hypothetical protein